MVTMRILSFTLLLCSFCLSGQNVLDAIAIRPDYITHSPSEVLATNESVILVGKVEFNPGCNAGEYLAFIPFNTEPLVLYYGPDDFSQYVELENYPNDIYFDIFDIIDICEQEDGSIAVSLWGYFSDVSSPSYRLILMMSPTGEVLSFETISLDSYDDEVALNCFNATNNVQEAMLPSEDGYSYQNGDDVIEYRFFDAGLGSLVYVERYNVANPLSTDDNIGISSLDVGTYYEYETIEGFCATIMNDIIIEVTNYGNEDVCFFDIGLERGSSPSSFCGFLFYNKRRIIIEECLAPGESRPITVTNWSINPSLSCQANICANLLSPNQRIDKDQSDNMSCFSAEIDFEACEGLPCYFGAQGVLNENCECMVIDIGIEDGLTQADLDIYPNPVEQQLSFSLEENAAIYLQNQNGQVLIQKEGVFGLNAIDMSKFPDGFYVLIVKGKNFIIREKLVKH